MDTIILSLRKFSLRLVMIITFAISFLTGFFSLINGKSLGITAILSVIGIVFFYITFAVHAIENEQKALRTAYLFVAAYVITLIGSFSSFNESPNFSTMIVEDIITGDNSIEEWANRTVASSAPYTILMNMFMLTGLFYPLQSICSSREGKPKVLTEILYHCKHQLLLHKCIMTYQAKVRN